ncbi:unnamed protein product [Clavelina lepadiformis]|uniref:BTB domain-containing protein n=1 Tax=Clavelina lepadiformis TaxID=159417 RepID=A0ABP0FLH4_CLALP
MLIFVLAVVLFLGKTAHGLLSQLNTQPRMEPSASEPIIQLEDNSEAAVSHIEIPEVVELNVGGSYFTTSLSTLRKYPNSMLAVMFSGRHNLLTDKDGRYFIDRDGRLFEFVLNFLRQGELPPSSESLKVYQEAQFYNIDEMCEELELFRPVAGEKLRKDFLTRVANYEDNLYMLMKNAQQTAFAHPTRICRLTVCVYKEENPSIPHNIINSEPVAGEWRPYKTQITHTYVRSLHEIPYLCIDVTISFSSF